MQSGKQDYQPDSNAVSVGLAIAAQVPSSYPPHRHQKVPEVSRQEDRRRPHPPPPVPPHLRHPPNGPGRADGTHYGPWWLEEFGDGQTLRQGESRSSTAACGSIGGAPWPYPRRLKTKA